MFSLLTLRVRQYLSIRSLIFLLPQELCLGITIGVRLPLQREGTDAKPDRSKQPIGKRSGVGGRTVTLGALMIENCFRTITDPCNIPMIMKLHALVPHESRMCPFDFRVKKSKVKVMGH